MYRPAARDQLEVLGSQIDVEVFNQPDSDDPVGIANAAVSHAKKNGHQVVIVDTAGRLAVDEVLMNEISAIHKSVSPSKLYLSLMQ